MQLKDVKYDSDRHFYYEIENQGDRASYQPDIDRFLVYKGKGFIWVDLFNKFGQCSELPKEWSRKREELFQFIGHPCMQRIINKSAMTEEDHQLADRAMRTFKREFCDLVRPEASFLVRCRYATGF